MRISDWSSDVCSSDLQVRHHPILRAKRQQLQYRRARQLLMTGGAKTMITRRRILGQTTAGAAIAGIWQGVTAAFAADTKSSYNTPTDSAPQIPASQAEIPPVKDVSQGRSQHMTTPKA